MRFTACVFASLKERRTTHQGTISACERRRARFGVWRRRRRSGSMAVARKHVRNGRRQRGVRVNWPDAIPQPESANDQQRQEKRERGRHSAGAPDSTSHSHTFQANRMPVPCCGSTHADPAAASPADTPTPASRSIGPSSPASTTRVVCFCPLA
jgi:hypothetical protein